MAPPCCVNPNQGAVPVGPSPICGPAVLVAVLIGVTTAGRSARLPAVAARQDAPAEQPVAPRPALATYTVFASGDITMAMGHLLMPIAGSTVAVAVRTGITFSPGP